MSRLLRWVDRNAALNNFLTKLSTMLSINRGLPMLVGTVLVTISLVVSAIVIPVIAFSTDTIWLLLCLPAAILHLGLIVAFIGFMVSAPLGRGFRE